MPILGKCRNQTDFDGRVLASPSGSVLPVVLEVRPSRDIDTVILGRRE